MKINHLLYLPLFALIFISCQNDHLYTVAGKINGLGTSDVYIVTSTDSTIGIDTIQSKSGKFKYTSVSETLEPLVIYMQNRKIWITVWVQNGENISISGDIDYPELIMVKGGEINNLLTSFKQENKNFIKEKEDLEDKILTNSRQAAEEWNVGVKEKDAHLSSRKTNVKHILRTHAEDFVQVHPGSIASLVLIQDYIADLENTSNIQPCLSLIEEPAKSNRLYKKLEKWSLKDQQTEIGKPAPDFSVIDTNQDTLRLEMFQDRYLLLTFSASWCSFCDMDYEEWLAVRKAFPENKLKILTVSLDENASDWKNLVEEKKFTWPQAIDNAGWTSSLVSLYNISELPCNYLIDKNGLIVGSKLNSDSILPILSELLKEEETPEKQ